MRLFCSTAALASLVALAGCEKGAGVSLIEVRGVAPTLVEASSRLEVKGAGFPVGREARITFLGALYRGGWPASEHVEISTLGKVANAETIRIEANDSLISEFCRNGSEERHATFEGVVRVAFASQVEGGGLVSGESQPAALDVFPRHLQKGSEAAREGGGAASLSDVGLSVQLADDGEGGAVVTDVTPSSIAAGLGVVQGERIVEANHVHVTRLSDLLPASAGQRRDLLIAGSAVGGSRRVQFPETDKSARWLEAAKVAAASLTVASLLVFVLLSRFAAGWARGFAPGLARALGLGSSRAAARVSQRTAKRERGAFALGLLTWTMFGVAASAYPAWRDRLDPKGLLLLCLIGATVLVPSARVGGWRRLLVSATSVAAFLMNSVSYLLLVGAITMRDVLLAQQGGGPRAWVLFHSVAAFSLGLATIASLVLVAAVSASGRRGPARSILEQVALAGGSVLFALLFLGGGSIASVSSIPDRTDVLLFALVLGAKGGGVSLFVRAAAPHVAARSPFGLSFSALAISAFAFVTDVLSATGSSEKAESFAAVSLAALALTSVGLLLRRMASEVVETTSRPRLNPFL